MRSRWAVCLGFLILWGCSSSQKPEALNRPPAPIAPADPWKITCLDATEPTPALLWNGLIGVRIGRDGSWDAPGGKSLPFFSIDQYDAHGEEKIATLQAPASLALRIGDEPLDPAKSASYHQVLDMKTGLLDSSWEQNTQTAGRVRVQCRTVVHPELRVMSSQWKISAEKDAELTASSAFSLVQAAKPSVSVRTWSTKANMAVPFGAGPRVDVSEETDIPGRWALNRWEGKLAGGSEREFTLTISFGPDPNEKPPAAVTSPERNLPNGQAITFDTLAKDTERIWAERWKTDIQIDGPVEDQQRVRSLLFYLRSAASPKGRMAVSPLGLSNQQYNGHVFWDADIWVFPALALIDPEMARVIPNYRIRVAEAAKQNAAIESRSGLKYPWESSVSGHETIPGPFQKEIHVTGSVLWGLNMAAELGLADEGSVRNLAELARNYYRSKAIKGPDGFALKGVMSPDESHVGDNDLYTNLLAQWLENGRSWNAGPGSNQYVLPHDDKGLLTYDRDTLRSYKQAAALLSVYPLQYPPAVARAQFMMDRFASKVIENGPAMTDSIHSIISCRLGRTEDAYRMWHKELDDFLKPPMLLFSEKKRKPITYFTTGAGGSLQAIVYGFLGFRLDSHEEKAAAWSIKLHGENWLSVRPCLPKAWRSVTFTGFSVLGKRYNLVAKQSSSTLTPAP